MDDLERSAHETRERIKQGLLKKIPVLNDKDSEIYLQRTDLKRLTDEEIVVLWTLPDVVIKLGKKAGEYLDERRKLLGLRANEHGRIVKEEQPQPRKFKDEWDELFRT